MENEFWNWSLDVYRRDGVEDALLALQDKHGLDVNVVLWCVWCGASGRGPAPESGLRRAVEISDTWTARVTTPLRQARRAAKKPPFKTNAQAAETLRLKIKDAELLSEQFMQMLLADIPGVEPNSAGDAEAAARRNLVRYATLCGAARKPGFSANLLLRVVETIFGADDDKSV